MKTFISFIMAAALGAMVIPTLAGTLTPPGAPSVGSGMPTTAAIFQQLSSGQAATSATSFQGPSAGPGASGKSLADIRRRLPAPDNTDGAAVTDVKAGKKFWGLRTDGTWGVKTGTSLLFVSSITCTGTLSPLGRWCDQHNGTVKDMTTGFVWLQDASCVGQKTFFDANHDIRSFSSSNHGSCSTLNDGSTSGSWYVPSLLELKSLVTGTEAVTPGDSCYFFSSVASGQYWSPKIDLYSSNYAWAFDMIVNSVVYTVVSNYFYVWPVRSGQ